MNIALLGYGKMGKEIEQVAIQRGHSIVLKMDISNAPSTGPDHLKKADVAIEFSTPETAVDNIYKCFQAGIPVVVGTTGWYKRYEEVAEQCRKGGHTLFTASNFSIGVNIFFRLNRELAAMMNTQADYQPSMEEIHHIHKKDSPSGTAITLAEGILEKFKKKVKWVNATTADPSTLSIISRREGEVPGTHIIRYASGEDEIEIMHTAKSRKGFAAGAVAAAEWLKDKKGIFGMEHMLAF